MCGSPSTVPGVRFRFGEEWILDQRPWRARELRPNYWSEGKEAVAS
jgi:hypothetical protein